MVYIPIVAHAPQPPSPTAQDLGNKLTSVIQQFQQQYPGVTDAEVRTAMRLALQQARPDTPAHRPAALVMVAGALAALAAGLIVARLPQSGAFPAMPGSVGIAVGIAVLAVVAILLRRRGE